MKIVKKRLWLIVLVSLLIVGVAIGLAGNKNEFGDIPQTEQAKSLIKTESAYEDLDELVRDAVIIVSGTIKDSSALDSTTIEYVLDVEQQFKGERTDESIHIYESYSDARYTIGKEYVFFLDRWEGGLYPAAVHTPIDEEHSLRIEQDMILHSYTFLEEDLQKRDFFEAIENSPSIHEPSPFEDSNNSSHMFLNNSISTLDELVEASDWIGRVIPTNIHIENKYFKNIGIKELESFKGTDSQNLEEVTTIYVPKTVELDKEYILFLTNHSGTYQVTTRDNSVVSKEESEEWQEILLMFQK
ncbi:hypothetical protein GGQ92_001320 [Gracilibacillus halotolerans]|uniref:Uncharacterized protein n=1 Tax=Gracilibacillus halotolerans TaxID=74386 RepID=A0A841RKY8_9BACI|nr:hypothetical protein [Gracilibacillus halotolerans]MBB6512537.1 hypothetical protein [Gracilibacillus halotolerans]